MKLTDDQKAMRRYIGQQEIYECVGCSEEITKEEYLFCDGLCEECYPLENYNSNGDYVE